MKMPLAQHPDSLTQKISLPASREQHGRANMALPPAGLI